ncbi:hypothetical protein CC79DRAFT_1317430 [Sarocladium strictum]
MASFYMMTAYLWLLCLAATAHACKTPKGQLSLQWGSCPEAAPYLNATAPIECATVRLPMDYTAPNSTLLWDAPLLRVKAPKQPSKGSIFVNWGGPGLPAIPNAVLRGSELMLLPGGEYDIVAFNPRGTDEFYQDFAPTFERLDGISRLRGASHAITAAVCAQWPIQAKETYRGGFDRTIETRTPLLFMGLTYDSPSSVAGAYNASASFANSVVVEVQGAGHTSYSLPSVCGAKNVLSYWAKGEVPDGDVRCEAETNP